MKKTAEKKALGESPVFEKSAQVRFLTQMIEERKKVAVFLVSGIKLEGEIVNFDQFVILMKGAMTDTVYKHAVSTIQPIEGARPMAAGRPRESAGRTPTIRQARPRAIRKPDES
ncbi:MAG TPA: RNA chaperone Hfq [Burkholderiales bacterium]|nr:RNA chaperone Hfq [Burkholderiales bacterium]